MNSVYHTVFASETGIVHYECQWYLLHPGISSIVTIVALSILQLSHGTGP